jgi:cell wall-associated NlpC family hydrolase
MPVSAAAVVAEARSWCGVPWRHQGRDRSGIDCGGLVVRVAHALDLSQYDTSNYARRAKNFEFLEHFRAGLGMTSVRMIEMRPGDVVIFVDRASPCHCGFVTLQDDAVSFVHAHALRRQVIEERFVGEWRAAAKFAFRWLAVVD